VVGDHLLISIRSAVRRQLTFDCGVLVDGAGPVDWDEVVSAEMQWRVKHNGGSTDTTTEADSEGHSSPAADDGRRGEGLGGGF
jgi:hypothetical protein